MTDACLRAGRGETGPPPQDLVLGTRHELGMSWIVPMLPSLRRRHPQLTIHLYFGSGRDILQQLRDGQLDGAVTSSRLDDPGLVGLPLHREDYVFVGAPALLRETPLRRPADAARHTLLDERSALPLYAYWRDSVGGGDRLAFGRFVYLGTIAAIRAAALAGDGIAVLPKYLIGPDLAAGRLAEVLPRVRPLHDFFRLIFRSDDPRRSLYQAIAATMSSSPLR